MRHWKIENDLKHYFENCESAGFTELVGYLRERNIAYDEDRLKTALNDLESEGSIGIFEAESNDEYVVKYLDSED